MNGKKSDSIWAVALALLMAGFFPGLASAQDSFQDQEQALRDALPKDGDLAPGLPWEEEDTSSLLRDSIVLQSQINYNSHYDIPTSDPNPSYQDDYHQTQTINAYVRWFSNTYQESGDDHRSLWLMQLPTMLPGDAIVEAYEGLPGGVIAHSSSRTGDQLYDITYEIYYWKNSKIDGSMHYIISTFCMDGCKKWCPGEVEKADALARSECERLAKLVWSRLPGDDVAQQSVLSRVEGGNVAGSQVQSFQEEAQAKMKEFEGEGPKAFENVPQQEFIGLSGIGKSIIQQAIFQEKLREYQEYGMHGYSLLITDEPSLNYDNSLTTLRHKEIYLPKMKSAFNSGTEEGYRQVIDLFYKAMEEDVTAATKRHESESKKSRTDEDKEDAVQNAPAARKYINERGEETYKPAPVK